MTHTHIETNTVGACLGICALPNTTETDARTHFDIGTGTVGLPSLQSEDEGVSFLSSHGFQRRGGGLRTAWGGGGCTWGCGRGIFSSFRSFLLSCHSHMVEKIRVQILGMPCYVVWCSGVFWSMRCEMVSRGVVLWFAVVVHLLWCDVVYGVVVCCGLIRCAVVLCVDMWCGVVSCGGVCCGGVCYCMVSCVICYGVM